MSYDLSVKNTVYVGKNSCAALIAHYLLSFVCALTDNHSL